MQALPAIWQNLKFQYPNGTSAISNLTLQVQAGETLALLGPNGAGKSTAIKLLLGLLHAEHGQVRVFGADPALASTRAHLGVVLQVSGLPNKLSVIEQIKLHASYFTDAADPYSLLERLGLTALSKRRLDALSGGERRRFEFALALIGNPKLLILDEPTAGIDIKERAMIMQLLIELKTAGTTMLLTTHLLDEAERLADRVAYLDQGALKFVGSVPELKKLVADTDVIVETAQDLLSWHPALLGDLQQTSARQWRVQTPDASQFLRALLLADVDAKVLSVQAASLESAITKLAQRSKQSLHFGASS